MHRLLLLLLFISFGSLKRAPGNHGNSPVRHPCLCIHGSEHTFGPPESKWNSDHAELWLELGWTLECSCEALLLLWSTVILFICTEQRIVLEHHFWPCGNVMPPKQPHHPIPALRWSLECSMQPRGPIEAKHAAEKKIFSSEKTAKTWTLPKDLHWLLIYAAREKKNHGKQNRHQYMHILCVIKNRSTHQYILKMGFSIIVNRQNQKETKWHIAEALLFSFFKTLSKNNLNPFLKTSGLFEPTVHLNSFFS